MTFIETAARRAADKFGAIKERHHDPAHTAHLPDGSVCNVCVVLGHLDDALAQAVQGERERLYLWVSHKLGCGDGKKACTCGLAAALRDPSPPEVTR